MVIGGLQKFSLLDYPEHLSAIIFTQGCNFRCQFCYNPMLVRPVGEFKNISSVSKTSRKQKGRFISETDLFAFLKERTGKLDAVVISGGEATIQSDLPAFLKKIKELRYKIKLDTNGTKPEMIKKLIELKLIDYIAMDVKAALEKYQEVTGIKTNLAQINKSIKIIIASGLPHEFRTTIVPGLHEEEDIEKIGKLIKGASKWYLQQFKSDTALINQNLKKIKPYSDEILKKMCNLGKKYVLTCEIR